MDRPGVALSIFTVSTADWCVGVRWVFLGKCCTHIFSVASGCNTVFDSMLMWMCVCAAYRLEFLAQLLVEIGRLLQSGL